MLKDWHKEDVFNVLRNRDWIGPSPLDVVSPMVGEAHTFTRGVEVLNLFYVTDIGTGVKGRKSIEAVWAQIEPNEERYELWLHRVRDAKWKKELHNWAEQISSTEKSTQSSNEI
jgi:hypothetical protein